MIHTPLLFALGIMWILSAVMQIVFGLAIQRFMSCVAGVYHVGIGGSVVVMGINIWAGLAVFVLVIVAELFSVGAFCVEDTKLPAPNRTAVTRAS